MRILAFHKCLNNYLIKKGENHHERKNNYRKICKRLSWEKLEIKQYLPYNLKVGFAQNIVNCSSFDKNKNFKLSSTLRYLFYIRTVITEYTNLTENKKNSSFLDEYDVLASTGLLEAIISKICFRPDTKSYDNYF